MFAGTAAVGLIGMCDFSGSATINQCNFMDGSDTGAADAGNIAQVQDEITGWVFINLVGLIHNLHKIRCVNVALKMHHGHRFACLLESNIDIHSLFHLSILTEIELFIMNIPFRETLVHKFFLEGLHHGQGSTEIYIIATDVPTRIFYNVIDG